MRGSDIFGTLSIPSGSSIGKLVLKNGQAITPEAFLDTRLKQLSDIHAKWRPVSLRLTATGSGTAFASGSVAIGWSPEALADMVGSNTSNLNRVMSMKPSMVLRLNETKSMTIPSNPTRKWYFTKGADEDSHHGALFCVVSGQTGGYSGNSTMLLRLDWTIQFEGAEMTHNSANDDITPDVGYSDLFTTSDGSFNSKILTFKMHHGGSMVPFSAAKPNKVYEPTQGTVVKYVSSEQGHESTCKFFARVQGYDTPGLLLFASKDDALTYIKTGDEDKCLKYISQGPVISPSIPHFAEVSVQTREENVSTSLTQRVLELERRLLALTPYQNLVKTTTGTAILNNLQKRPLGTLTDPVKVVSEDPVMEYGSWHDLYDSRCDT